MPRGRPRIHTPRARPRMHMPRAIPRMHMPRGRACISMPHRSLAELVHGLAALKPRQPFTVSVHVLQAALYAPASCSNPPSPTTRAPHLNFKRYHQKISASIPASLSRAVEAQPTTKTVNALTQFRSTTNDKNSKCMNPISVNRTFCIL